MLHSSIIIWPRQNIVLILILEALLELTNNIVKCIIMYVFMCCIVLLQMCPITFTRMTFTIHINCHVYPLFVYNKVIKEVKWTNPQPLIFPP